MNKDISIEIWNEQIVKLMQAMLGAISPNFRMITVENEQDVFVLRFYLEEQNSEDFKEIDEIVFEFVALQDNGKFECKQEIIVINDRLDWPKFPTRVVYRRRE